MKSLWVETKALGVSLIHLASGCQVLRQDKRCIRIKIGEASEYFRYRKEKVCAEEMRNLLNELKKLN